MIRPIAFIDTWALVSAIWRNKKVFEAETRRQGAKGSPHHSTQSIFLRGPATVDEWFDDVPQSNYARLGLPEWKAAKSALLRVERAVGSVISAGMAPGEMGKAMIVLLKPHSHVDWHTDEGEYAKHHDRFHLPLITNPAAVLYSGGAAFSPLVGQLVFFDNHVEHSAVNGGDLPRVHLIVDFRKPEAA